MQRQGVMSQQSSRQIVVTRGAKYAARDQKAKGKADYQRFVVQQILILQKIFNN
jgi:hypothetical protein